MAVAMFAGRPLGDTEHLSAIGDVLMSISVPQPIRSWLLRALHMDPRRVFVHAGEASKAFTEAINESGLRPAPRDLDLQQSRSLRSPRPRCRSRPAPTPITVAPAKSAPVPRPAAAAPAPKRDVWQGQAHDVDQRVSRSRAPPSPERTQAIERNVQKVSSRCGDHWPDVRRLHRRTVPSRARVDVLPNRHSGHRIDSPRHQSAVNGKPQGVTPLTLRVEAGIHEVELHGPGKPRIFKVHVTRGDRVAQYIEFVPRR